jgi:hypothetical protein
MRLSFAKTSSESFKRPSGFPQGPRILWRWATRPSARQTNSTLAQSVRFPRVEDGKAITVGVGLLCAPSE